MPTLENRPDTLHLQQFELPQADDDSTRETAEEAATQSEASSFGQAIDLNALARKVYALFKEELKIEQERLGHFRNW